MTTSFTVGDILRGEKNEWEEAYHPIIYLGEHEPGSPYFVGCMMTKSYRYGNAKLLTRHYTQKPANSPKNSCIVRSYLLKKRQWGPFTNVGELSPEGIDFVQEALYGTEPVIWEDYINR